jgi:hypothetical protein
MVISWVVAARGGRNADQEGVHLALQFIGGPLLRGDVGAQFHELADAVHLIFDRGVHRLHPDFTAVFGDPLVYVAKGLAGVQIFPETRVRVRMRRTGVHKHFVVLADDVVAHPLSAPENRSSNNSPQPAVPAQFLKMP